MKRTCKLIMGLVWSVGLVSCLLNSASGACQLVRAFAFGEDDWTRPTCNDPATFYTKISQATGEANMAYSPEKGYGYVDSDALDRSPNNRGVYTGDDEIYDQFIGAKEKEGSPPMLFRIDIDNGNYRFVAAGGDPLNYDHATTIRARDGETGPGATLVSDFQPAAGGQFWAVEFADKVVPPASTTPPTFISQPESPVLVVTQGGIIIEQDIGSRLDGNGGDLCLLEVWDIGATPFAFAGPDLVVVKGETVILDGTASINAEGFLWEQIGGDPPVSLTDPDNPVPTFSAPNMPGSFLKFRLTVTGPEGEKDLDTVVVFVSSGKPVPPSLYVLPGGYFPEMLHLGSAPDDRVTGSDLSIATDYLTEFGGEANVNPSPGDVIDFSGTGIQTTENPMVWTPQTGKGGQAPDRYADNRGLDDFIMYFHLDIISPEQRDARFHFLHDDEIRGWNNSVRVLSRDGWDERSEQSQDFVLQAGTNSMTFKLREGLEANRLAVRITDRDDNSFGDLQYMSYILKADAGPDQTGVSSKVVTLDGSATTNAEGYLWEQVSGPPVVLSDPYVMSPTFTAPDFSTGAPLVFRLIAASTQGFDIDSTRVYLTDLISSGETVYGDISAAGQMDSYAFDASAGDVARILIGTGPTYFCPRIELYDPEGALVTSAGQSGYYSATITTQLLEKGGTYTVIARAYDGLDSGTYGLSLVKMPGEPSLPEIVSGETKTGSIDVGDLDAFVFAANGGDVARVLIGTDGSFYPRIELYDPEGVLVASAGASGYYVASITTQPLEKGTCTVIVRAYDGRDTGTYGLSLIKMPGSTTSEQDPDGGEIVSGETKTGTIGLADLDACTFQAIAGEVVKILIGVDPADFYPRIELYDPEGALVASAGQSGYYSATITTQLLEKSGTYTVIARAYDGRDTGTYGLSLVKIVEFTTYIASPTLSGSILVGDTLRFSADTTRAAELGIVQCQWDFGDGRSSTLKDPGLITFPTPGEKIVTLSVVVGQSQFNPTTRTITVVDDTGSAPDLAVTQLNVPENLSINQPAEVSYAVQNIGNEAISGKSWKDALYLSRDPYLDVNDRLLVSTPLSTAVGVGGTYANSLIATIPVVGEGAYYLLLSVDDRWEVLERHQLNNEFAVATDLVIPLLAEGVSSPGRFTASGDARYYRMDVPSGQNLFLRLDDLDDLGVNEIYVRFGSLPTRGTYDYRANVSGKADQELLVPAATSGTWYVMVYGASVPGEGDFSLEATFSQLKVTGVVPNSNPSTAEAVLTISGAGFYGTMTVELVAGGGTAYPADTVEVDSFTQITATFTAGTVPPDVYSVRVSRGDDSDTLVNAFKVLPDGEAKLETNLIVPSQLGYHVPATIYVEYRNAGDASMPAPLLLLTATQNGHEGAFLTLEAGRVVQGFWTSAMPEGFSHSVQILASGEDPGVLRPGESARVPVYYAGWQQPWDFSYPAIQFNLGVLTAHNTMQVEWAALKDSMKPASISAEAWEAIWANFVSQVGDTWGDYLKMLDENASYLGRLGQRVVDVGQLLAFEFLQADGLSPLRSLAAAVDAAVEAPGLPLVFTRTFGSTISQRSELGPLGRGWSHNWQYSLQKAPDGTVTIIGPGGSHRTFQPDSRSSGRYFSQPGDQATLTALGGGSFMLREPGGLLRAFRSDGKPDYVEDPNGNRISVGYSGSLLRSLTHYTNRTVPSGHSLEIAYSGASRIESITGHPVGRRAIFLYDAAGEHLVSVQYYDGRVTTYDYSIGSDPNRHALAEITLPGGTHRYFAYDAQGRLSRTSRDGDAEAVNFSYDNAGKVTATDGLGHSSEFCFDHRGLLTKTEDALNNAVHLAFDDNFNLVRLTDPAGRSHNYGYDDRGNLIRSTDPLSHATRFTFAGAFDRLASVTDANGNLTRYAYTTNGNLESITYADGSQESWNYDTLGNATTWTNRRGRAINYDYDAAGRITKKTYTADGSHVDYVYDDRGNLFTATDSTGTTTFKYDPDKDYVMRIDYPGGQWLEFSYDAAGRRDSSEDQLGHRLNYHYDAVGRLESMTDESGAEVVHYSYDATGRHARKTLGNGVYTTYEYDAAGQLLHLVNFNTENSVLSRFDYTYDSRGRRTSMDTLDGKWTYEYDDLGQLTHAVFDSNNLEIPNQDLTYVYDALGNRIRTIENSNPTEYTTNNMNQYVRVGDTDYDFDADGNLIQEISPQGTTTYTYSDEKRLVAVHKHANTWEYAYDAFGNRVATMENGTTTRYVIDPIGLGNVVGEYDDSGSNLIAHYDHGLGLLSRTDSAGNPAYYTSDAIGNSHQLVTDAGVIANSYAYAPFGALLSRTETIPNSFQFLGGSGLTHEPSGLIYMRSRFFDANRGRFLSQDPLGFAGGSANLYAYVGNLPLQAIDPSGLKWTWENTSDLVEKSSPLVLGLLGMYFCSEENIYAAFTGLLSGGASTYGNVTKEFTANSLRAMSVTRFLLSLAKASSVGTVTAGSQLIPVIGAGFFGWETGELLSRTPLITDPTITYGEWWGQTLLGMENWIQSHVPIPRTTPGGSGSSGSSGSTDPNTKTGPAGFGTSGFISPNGTFAYRIDFENEPNATAPAQQVVITDQLSTNLDQGTFQLTELGFGDQLIVVPANTQQYETSVPVRYLDTDFEVQIEAGINLASGQVHAVFRSIDPATGLPPTVDIGFLPPEDDTGRGQGHVSYVIRPKAGLPTGTEIRNVADISFDYQPTIATNLKDPHDPTKGTDPAKECLNTIDADPPTSSVAALPASSCSQFLVSWSGEDIGAGIASYDVYVSDNGGEWTLWLAATTGTCDRYDGEVGHTYAFYSIAHDNVGHSEPLPPVADATTKITDRCGIISVLYVEGAQLTWSSSPGEAYIVWSRSDLVSGVWNAEASVPSQGQVTTWTDPDTTSTRKFYRIGIE
jgi:RHS repeat-associated protein